jgi:hypothetical protein
MFSAIAELWRGARADNLRKEVVDCLDRVMQSPADVQALCAINMIDTLDSVKRQFGTVNNLPTKRRRQLSKNLSAIARKRFASDLGGGYGIFLASAHIEASALQGIDADAALEATTRFLEYSLAAKKVAEEQAVPRV